MRRRLSACGHLLTAFDVALLWGRLPVPPAERAAFLTGAAEVGASPTLGQRSLARFGRGERQTDSENTLYL